LPQEQSAAVLSRLRPLPAPYDFLAGKALRQFQQESFAFLNPAQPDPTTAAAIPATATATSTPPAGVNADRSSQWASNTWLQPAKDLLSKGQTVLQATDALPAAALEAELKAQLEAATVQLQIKYEQQLLNAQVLAAEANAARAKELAAAQAAVQATMAHLQKLNAALDGEILLEKKKTRLIAALPPGADQTSDNEAGIPAPTNRSYQFSYNEVSESPIEMPLFSPRASLLPMDARAADSNEFSEEQNEAGQAQSAEKITLQLPVLLPDAMRARIEKEAKAGKRSSVLPSGKPRVVISL
jgi:hypothetical protein